MADVMGDDRLLKMKDEDGVVSPFEGIEKGSVLQDCRCFNDLQLDTQKCEAVLVRLLYLVGQGEKLSSAEATDVFFSVTKLFQANAVRFDCLSSVVGICLWGPADDDAWCLWRECVSIFCVPLRMLHSVHPRSRCPECLVADNALSSASRTLSLLCFSSIHLPPQSICVAVASAPGVPGH